MAEPEPTSEYPHIILHESPAGHRAHVLGTGLAVWELVKASRAFDGDTAATAEYFQVDPALVAEGMAYACRFPEEIEAAIRRHEEYLERYHPLSPGGDTSNTPHSTRRP